MTETGDQAQRPCPYCDGILWETERTSELNCDTCHASFSASWSPSRAARQASRHEDIYSPPDRDTYDSGAARLIGGYQYAYYSWVNGPEYAIDAYDDVTEGLFIPHERDWDRGPSAAPA